MSANNLLSYLALLYFGTLSAGCSDSGSEPLAVGELFPVITVIDLFGNKIEIPSSSNATARLISIRTLGCRFCESDFKELEKLYQHFKRDKLDIIVINVGFDKENAENFLKDKSISFQLLIDETMESMKTTHTSILPVAYLIDSNNKIFCRIQGGFSSEEIKDVIDNFKKY